MRIRVAKNVMRGLAVVWLLLGGTARSAIVLHDGSTNSISFTQNTNSSSITNSFTVTAGADVLVVSTYIQNNAGSDYPPDLSAWGGQSFTQIAGGFNARATYAQCDIFYIVNPTPGTQSIVVTDTSGGAVTAMAMQVYTLSGVDTTVFPSFYGASAAYASSDSLLLSGPPTGGWAAFSICLGYSGTGTTITSTSGTIGYAQVQAGDAVFEGAVANLGVGDTTITVGNPGAGGVQSALAVAVFAPYILPGTPTPPMNVAATGQTNQIALSWADSSGGAATSYILQRSTNSGGGYLPIVTNAGNANVIYTDTNVVNFRTYYYVVEAVNAIGTSLISSQASAAAVGLAAVPTGLSAKWGDSVVTLTWNAQASADGFNVLRSTTSGGGFSLLANVTTNGYIDATVANFTTYYYVINASNSFGTSANSAQVSASPGPILTNYFGVFNSSADVSKWGLVEGNNPGIASFTNDAPAGGPSGGCLVSRVNYANSMSGGIGNHSLPHYNETNATALEFDIKNLGTWYQNNGIQQLQPVLLSDAYGGMTWNGPGIPQSSSNTNNGWVHVVMPISSNDGSNVVNWRGIYGINLIVNNSPWYSTATNMLIGYANFKFTGAPGYQPVFSGLLTTNITGGTPSVTLTGTVSGGKGNYLASNTVITVIIKGTPQTTTISGATGHFSLSYNTAGLSQGVYPVTYACAADNQIFVAATNTATSLTVTAGTPNAPRIVTPRLDATGTNLVVSVQTQTGYNYYLLSTTNLAPPVVWTTNSIAAGTNGMITNLVPMSKSEQTLFLKYLVK
jgi:hypothetical protein